MRAVCIAMMIIGLTAGAAGTATAQTLESCSADVDAAVAEYLVTPPQQPDSIFDFMYETVPADLARQRDQLVGETGDDG